MVINAASLICYHSSAIRCTGLQRAQAERILFVANEKENIYLEEKETRWNRYV